MITTLKFLKPAAVSGVILAGMTVGSVQAAESTLVSKFSVSFLGLNVGKLVNSAKVTDTSYEISGAVRANSLVSLVSKTKATFASAGKFSGTGVIPNGFNLKYQTSKKRGNTRLNYSGGNVISVSATPKIKYKPGSVPVQKSHLKAVTDPLSALLFKVDASDVGNGKRICDRTISMFDGKSRFNLRFSYKGKSVQKAKGFKGEVFDCAVRYEPISGIRPKKKNIKFMKANRNMQVSMARIADSNVYALFAFNVKTDKGTAAGKAYSFISN